MRTLFTSLAFWAIALMISAPFVVWFGPSLEERFFPVLGSQVVTVERNGNEVTFSIVVEKLRDCRFVEATYSIGRIRGDTVDRAPLVVKNLASLSPEGTATYPPGRIGTGPFLAIIPDLFLDGPSIIEGLIVYDCHGGIWYIEQIFGPVIVPPAP